MPHKNGNSVDLVSLVTAVRRNIGAFGFEVIRYLASGGRLFPGSWVGAEFNHALENYRPMTQQDWLPQW